MAPAALLSLLTLPVCAGQLDESAVKAGFLYNFAQFVEWPPGSEPMTFCVIGNKDVGHYLKSNLAGKSLDKRRIEVRPDAAPAELAGCHLVYFGKGAKKVIANLLQALVGKPALLVGDDPDLGSHGVPINFYLDDERVRFEINMAALDKAGVHISSKLLSLGHVRQ